MQALKAKSCTLHTVNGEQSIEAVFEEIKKALNL